MTADSGSTTLTTLLLSTLVIVAEQDGRGPHPVRPEHIRPQLPEPFPATADESPPGPLSNPESTSSG